MPCNAELTGRLESYLQYLKKYKNYGEYKINQLRKFYQEYLLWREQE